MRNKYLIIGGAVAGLAVLGFLAFGVFGIHTLFIDEEVDEANPFATTPAAVVADAPEAVDETEPEGDPETGTDEPGATATETPLPGVETLASGTFVDGAHPTNGTASVITDGSGPRFLRFEEFETDNGPDLNVYLRSSLDPDDYVDLGDLKGNIGDQNYELPVDLDLSVYDSVDIWCVRFGVSFGMSSL